MLTCTPRWRRASGRPIVRTWPASWPGAGRSHVEHKAGNTAMARMFDLGDILELIVDGFDQRAFSQPNFVGHRHQFVFHILLDFSNELKVLFKEQIEQSLGDIAFIG